ncbi:winged helix-turn-helix transcriptional regulator [Saccharibacter sp. 17.LH.SD]|uniref:Lrp/AsnC family transcriptional regulator n=1 Tax=Saccharibacter sp. 17.LH.SD TaxID=2689393 RepID=UPI00136B8602|nr:Lrp/AsnC family transcriptional regulator [Saccharibacter sp. 17.LH.SD]MXV45011.1 winged helix-turn-helix transcriptional regulator [Saccharibacter sp. 17.LH.SD]
MDHFDWHILSALQKNGRLTNRELSEVVALSPSQCSRRRLTLEKESIIRGYSVRIHGPAVGLNVMAFVQVSIKDHSTESFGAFQKLVESNPMIQEAYAVSGDADYMLKLVAETLESLSDFVTTKLLALQTVSHVKSYIGLKSLKEVSPLPLYRPSTSPLK